MPQPPTDESAWELLREELRLRYDDFTFHMWLEPLTWAGRHGSTLVVRAPAHVRTWVCERHLPELNALAARMLGKEVTLDVVDEHWAPAASSASQERGGGATTTAGDDLLNPKYTFDQFVISDGSQLAHAAALAVAEQPAQAYNPLFIYGPPGLGKTHLLHAIGNYVQLHGNGLTVRYATIETFTNEFVAAVRGPGTEAFKRRFREPDVLLIDDVQFLADKVRTKEEFFHSFNALYESGRQLVITSDQSPGDLDRVEARLRERFGSGLVAELTNPDFEARTAILRKRCGLDSVHEVGDDTVVEIARRVPGSVRVLEGALIRVVAYASLKGLPATPALARDVLSRLYPGAPATHSCTPAGIQAATAEVFGVAPASLVAQDRRPRIALARQVAMYLVRELTDESLPSIGAGFGGRNHSTVVHALRRVPQRMDADTDVRVAVEKLRATLGGSPTDRA